MNKLIIILSLISILVVSGCVGQPANGDSANESSLMSKEVEDLSSDNNTEQSSERLAEESAENKYEFDKCKQYWDNGYSVAESCYEGKYLEYVQITEDHSICNEIESPKFMGQCFGVSASKQTYGRFCQSIPLSYYEAFTYYDLVSSREECYYYFVQHTSNVTQSNDACDQINNIQLKQDCEQFVYIAYKRGG